MDINKTGAYPIKPNAPYEANKNKGLNKVKNGVKKV
tara:strand:+ start:275 stop:382 length:108 start_codon:yes stop_codon:yes gene_type:complete